MKKHRFAFILLALCLLCSACTFSPHRSGTTETSTAALEADTHPAASSEEEPVWSLVFPRKQNGGNRDYLPEGDIAMLRFSDMEYSRPDVEGLCAAFDSLTASVEEGTPAADVLSVFFEVYDQYYHFYSMNALANIRYYADMGNEYYKTEYAFCEQASPEIEENMERFLKSCAISDQKTALETQYFGEGALDQYIDYSVYTNPEYLALAKQEKTVMEAYHKALEDPQIVFEGKQQSYHELLEQYGNDNATYLSLLETYYQTYNPIIGEYYVELIRIRRQMAQVLDYACYADFCYEQTYTRDYSLSDGNAYVASIRNEIVPLYLKVMRSGLLDYLRIGRGADEKLLRSALRRVTGSLGGIWQEAYNFMIAYDLCDLSMRTEKMDASFTTYIREYEVPYILINAQGTTDDIFTFAHEFGHFVDSYDSYESEEDLETAETFSQGMEWLALCYLGDSLPKKRLEAARIQKLSDTLGVFVSQAAYTDFENRVYALSEEELTVDTLNAVYRSICKDYGFYASYADFYYSLSWIDIPHFFEAPYYMISYCVSADAALQIYQRELEDSGSGSALYQKLLERAPGDGLQTIIQAAGMENPFEEGRMEEIASFLQTQLGLDK